MVNAILRGTLDMPFLQIPTYQNFLTAKITKMWDLILITLLKMQPTIVNPVIKRRPHPH